MAWVIGDVHGCIKTLEALLEKIPKNQKIIFVGDLIDRGSGSMDVINLVRNEKYDCIRGNHEDAMIKEVLSLLEDNSKISSSFWVTKCGGLETLKSYNSSVKEQVVTDVKWLETLPYYKEYEDIKDINGRHLVVSHSSIASSWHLKDSNRNSPEYYTFCKRISTMRNSSPEDISNIFNIFGHSPTQQPLIKNHFANIDTSACYNEKKDYGVLSALEFPSLKVISQKNID